jgi:hypothetical protein
LREIRRRQPAEQRARAHIGLAETGAFLAAQAKKLQRPARPEAAYLEAGKHDQTGDDAGAAVEIAALRDGIEMRAAGQKGNPGSEPSSVTTRLAPASRSVRRPSARALASMMSSAALSPRRSLRA